MGKYRKANETDVIVRSIETSFKSERTKFRRIGRRERNKSSVIAVRQMQLCKIKYLHLRLVNQS